jgi:hypothetical protein
MSGASLCQFCEVVGMGFKPVGATQPSGSIPPCTQWGRGIFPNSCHWIGWSYPEIGCPLCGLDGYQAIVTSSHCDIKPLCSGESNPWSLLSIKS